MGQLIDAMLEGGLDPLLKIVTKDSKITLFFFFINFYIVETLYIPVTVINSDNAVEVSMIN
jgi:hypothetical protein